MSEAPIESGSLPTARQVTGDPAVDEVVAELDRLAGLPVHEHTAAFEVAHERLRGLLADAGETYAP